MGRRYSAISNYAIGQNVRMFVVFIVGGALTWVLLPMTGIIHTQDEQIVSSLIVAVVLMAIAKRHT
jgi:hypothetical protein